MAADDKWRPITPEELAMTAGKVDPNADAEAIFWEIRVDSGSNDLILENYVRVKVFNERGREQFARLDIPYVKGETKIRDISVRVSRAGAEPSYLNDADAFDRDVVRKSGLGLRARSVAIPNLEPGAIIEYRYKEVYSDVFVVGISIDLQQDIPVQSLKCYYRPRYGSEPIFKAYNVEGVSFVKEKQGFYLLERFGVSAFKEERQMPPMRSVKAWIRIQNSSRQTTVVGGQRGQVRLDPTNVQNYWAGFATTRLNIVEKMRPTKEIKQTAETIVAGAKTDEEKLQRLYEFSQKNIKNLDYSATGSDERENDEDEDLSVVLKNREGQSLQIDLLFGAMASALGFQTAIAFAGDRQEMFFNPNMTDSTLVHQAAIAVKTGSEEWKFYNPGVPVLPPGVLHWAEQDVYALLIDMKQNRWAKTPMMGHEESVSNRVGRFKLSEDGTLEGAVRVEFTGQSAISRRLVLYEETSDKRVERVANDVRRTIPDAVISAVSVDYVDDYTKPLTYSYKIKIPKFAEKTGKRLFVKASFFEFGQEPLFSASERIHGIYFRYPWTEKDDVEIVWPDGYELDNADQPDDVADPQKVLSLQTLIGVNVQSRVLKLRRDFYFGGATKPIYVFGVKNYMPLKNLFDMIHKSDNHTISLKSK